MSESLPEEKPLQTASFAVHATRGVIRDQKSRRITMLVLVVLALTLLVAGSTFLQSILSPQDHPGWFILFWVICAWLTFTAVLLAVFDLLLIRARRRKVKKALQEKLVDGSGPNSSAE